MTDSKDYAEYLNFIKSNPGELQRLIQTMTIKVSSFFRNPVVFEALRNEIVPMLIADFGSLRTWSIGCAEGEEPYSIAIISRELLDAGRISFSFHILGTDIDPDAIRKAMIGEYSDEELFETSTEIRDRYFRKIESRHSEYGSDRWIISEDIRSMVRFDCFNIMDLLYEKKNHHGKYNLILCRNVLIYFNREIQEKLCDAISQILFDGGYLVIGETETLPETIQNRFIRHSENLKIFRKF